MQAGAICAECSVVVQESELKINPGVADGNQYNLKGQDNQHSGQETEDLIFVISIIPNSKFSRSGDHILSTVDVDLLTAL